MSMTSFDKDLDPANVKGRLMTTSDPYPECYSVYGSTDWLSRNNFEKLINKQKINIFALTK